MSNATSIDGEETITQMQISSEPDEFAMFTYAPGNAREVNVKVHKDILSKFLVLKKLNEDMPLEHGVFFANIPIIHDADSRDVYFDENELELFFTISEMISYPLFNEEEIDKTLEDNEAYLMDREYFRNLLYIEIAKHLNEKAVDNNLIIRFLLLSNYLDNANYLHILSKYYSEKLTTGEFIII